MLFTDSIIRREELREYKVPKVLKHWEQRATKSKIWVAIPHSELADAVVASVENEGLEVTGESYVVSMNGDALMGEVEVKPVDPLSHLYQEIKTIGDLEAKALSMRIIYRHSNNGRWALHFMGAAKVQVCSNGLMVDHFGDLKLKKKHAGGLSLLRYIKESVQTVLQSLGGLYLSKKRLQEAECPTSLGDHLIIETILRKIIKKGLVDGIGEIWRKPPHEEFEPRNMWSLFNAFTEVLKKKSPKDQVESIPTLFQFLSAFIDESEETPVARKIEKISHGARVIETNITGVGEESNDYGMEGANGHIIPDCMEDEDAAPRDEDTYEKIKAWGVPKNSWSHE